MRTTYWSRFVVVVMVLALGLCVSTGYAQQAGKKEYAFKGKVEKIDPKAKTLTVNGENVPGWMAAMTMTYTVDKDETLNAVKAGDQITAKVYEGDFKKLYDVKVVAPPARK
jgi:Cu/Ag efflux protein CusF